MATEIIIKIDECTVGVWWFLSEIFHREGAFGCGFFGVEHAWDCLGLVPGIGNISLLTARTPL